MAYDKPSATPRQAQSSAAVTTVSTPVAAPAPQPTDHPRRRSRSERARLLSALAAGQLPPTNLRKHLLAAELPDDDGGDS